MQSGQTAPYSTHNVGEFWVKVRNKVKFSLFHLFLFFVCNGFRPFSFDNLKKFPVNQLAVIPGMYDMCFVFYKFTFKYFITLNPI